MADTVDEDYCRELEARIERVAANYRDCTVCELRCAVNRWEGELGRCLLPRDAFVYKEYLHFGEEESIVPTHTIFFSGCNFRCRECSDWRWVVKPTSAPALDYEALAARIRERVTEGARNLHFVGGEVEVNLYAVLRLLLTLGRRLPIVWNSNLYGSPLVYEVLDGLVTTYIADLKHPEGPCAEAILGVPRYYEIVTRNLRAVVPTAEVIVRHLALPGHFECCTRPLLMRLREEFPDVTPNLMTGFYPFQRRAPTVLPRRLTNAEKSDTIQFFQELGFKSAMIDGRWDKRSGL
ncbi:MAG: 4Fe-4S cluster-binding domain-containing protein [Myxococcales bacterium]|nr:4Fe-4S cluster-binding domain-containing protein [Myxococcales bacterium]